MNAYRPIQVGIGVFEVSEQGDAREAPHVWHDFMIQEVKATYPHSKLSSSDLSIFLNLVSLNALIRAYSASPSCKRSASKLPIQPRSRGARPGRDDRVFHVTNNGLGLPSVLKTSPYTILHALFVVGERGGYGRGGRECTVQSVKCVETVLRKTIIGSRLLDSACSRIWGEKGHQRGRVTCTVSVQCLYIIWPATSRHQVTCKVQGAFGCYETTKGFI
jgi:hypothetical protein